jgi:hypothetical protein
MNHSTTRRTNRRILLATTLLVTGAATAATAQTRSLTWTESTRMEVPGALGLLLRATGATSPTETRSAVHLQGRALIQESGSTTTVMDLDAGRWLMIDHDAREYSSLTFEELAQLTEEALRGTYAAAGQPGADAAAAREEFNRTMEEAQATIQFRVSSDATGQRTRVGAYDAAQHFITTEFEATAVPEGVEEREGGSMLFLAELWQTGDVPSGDALFEEWARQLASDPRFRQTVENLSGARDASEALAQSLSTWNPQVGAGMMQMAEAMEALTGTTVRSTVTVALVPLGASVDRNALLAWEPASMGDQLRAGAADAARQAAGDAVRGAVGAAFGGAGRLGGLRGRGDAAPAAAEPEPAAAAPSVRPLFRIVTTREDIAYRQSSEDVLGTITTRIAGYQERAVDR